MPDLTEYIWNAGAGIYINAATGRFVKFTDVLVSVEDIVDFEKERMGSVTDQLIAHEISLADWQSQMMSLIKQGNNMVAVAARGGIDQMSFADWGAVGNATRDQYAYLRNFAQEIADGKQPLNGSARVRAQLYADAIENQFERFRRRNEAIYNGAQEERRIIDPAAEHCETRVDKDTGEELIGCVELAAMGWRKVGTLPHIGKSPCIVRCRCHFIFRKKEDEMKTTIISSQRYIDNKILNEKIARFEADGTKEITLKVWDLHQGDMAVLFDGHHTLEAARQLEIKVNFEIVNHPENLKGNDLLEQGWLDSEWYNVETGRLVF